MNIQDVLLYGHIFNDNGNRQIRDARRGGYLTDMLMARYYRYCQAMWYSSKLQNRVRFQIAAVRISPGDVMKEEQRDYWERIFSVSVTNNVDYHRDRDRWLFPGQCLLTTFRLAIPKQAKVMSLYTHISRRATSRTLSQSA